jgi:uroporphyrin-III C-methyltransferase/precorrin-2 dehydrogenase/sirohydrochlorin ferrochelatase
VASGHLPPGHPDSLVSWASLAQLRGTLVLLMAVENIGAIASVLVENGKPADTPAAVVQDGSLSSQRSLVTTLDRLAEEISAQGLRPPAAVVIGAVVELARAG